MNKVPSISIFEEDNPDGYVKDLAEEWNSKHKQKYWLVAGDWRIDFKTDKDPEFIEMEGLLKKHEDEMGLDYTLWYHVDYDEADVLAADMVHIEGAEFIDKSRMKAFWNSDSMDYRPCTTCGFGAGFYSYVTEPIVMSEGVLNAKIGRRVPHEGGWDILSPKVGFLVLSRRIIEAFENANARGFKVMPVISKETGKIWDKVGLLQAEKSIVVGCEEHTTLDGGKFCRECGRVVGKGGLRGPKYLRSGDVGDYEIITVKPNPSTYIYISQRLHKILLDMKAQGLNSVKPAYICRHAEK